MSIARATFPAVAAGEFTILGVIYVQDASNVDGLSPFTVYDPDGNVLATVKPDELDWHEED